MGVAIYNSRNSKVGIDKYLVGIGKFDKPVEKIKNFLFCTVLGKVTTMHNDISSWQVSQLLMPVVSIGDLKDSHFYFNLIYGAISG